MQQSRSMGEVHELNAARGSVGMCEGGRAWKHARGSGFA